MRTDARDLGQPEEEEAERWPRVWVNDPREVVRRVRIQWADESPIIELNEATEGETDVDDVPDGWTELVPDA